MKIKLFEYGKASKLDLGKIPVLFAFQNRLPVDYYLVDELSQIRPFVVAPLSSVEEPSVFAR